MSIPIVFIHSGDDEYLYYSLNQAKHSNPKSSVFLIGDSANRHYASESIHHLMLEDYYDGAMEFASVYQHHSPNTYDYELFCFQRWYILRDFMRAFQMDRCLYLDSDIMLYDSIDDPEYARFTNIWTMLSFNTSQSLDNFCKLMRSYYCDPSLLGQLHAYTALHQFPGVSDMVFSRLFVDYYPEYSNHQNGVFQDSFFDGNIRHPQWFPPYHDGDEVEMRDGTKKVYFQQGKFFVKLKSGKYVRVVGQHFQGDNKAYMRYFLTSSLPALQEHHMLYFDFTYCQWLPA